MRSLDVGGLAEGALLLMAALYFLMVGVGKLSHRFMFPAWFDERRYRRFMLIGAPCCAATGVVEIIRALP